VLIHRPPMWRVSTFKGWSRGFYAVLHGAQLVLQSCVLTVLDLDEVYVTSKNAKIFGSMLSGEGEFADGWRCRRGAPGLPQLPPVCQS
jgi:hypothetical protein